MHTWNTKSNRVCGRLCTQFASIRHIHSFTGPGLRQGQDGDVLGRRAVGPCDTARSGCAWSEQVTGTVQQWIWKMAMSRRSWTLDYDILGLITCNYIKLLYICRFDNYSYLYWWFARVLSQQDRTYSNRTARHFASWTLLFPVQNITRDEERLRWCKAKKLQLAQDLMLCVSILALFETLRVRPIYPWKDEKFKTLQYCRDMTTIVIYIPLANSWPLKNSSLFSEMPKQKVLQLEPSWRLGTSSMLLKGC